MKVKVGLKNITLPKKAIANHMANLVATRSFQISSGLSFAKEYARYKEIALRYLTQKRSFVYEVGSDYWLSDFLKFEKKERSVHVQDMVVSFSDGTTWSVSLHDIASLRMLIDNDCGSLEMILSQPVPLVEWAQENLSWSQIESFAILKSALKNPDEYNDQWPQAPKKIIRWMYDNIDN